MFTYTLCVLFVYNLFKLAEILQRDEADLNNFITIWKRYCTIINVYVI